MNQLNQTGAIKIVKAKREKYEIERKKLIPLTGASAGEALKKIKLDAKIEAANEILAELGETVSQN